jgi:hypothetical protein
MRTFEIHEYLYDKKITAQVTKLDCGLHVSLYGGELSHIGAVTVISPEGIVETMQFSGHKEGALAESWAKTFAEKGYFPVVMEAGIHYNNLGKAGIEEVLSLCQNMLSDVLAKLSDGE